VEPASELVSVAVKNTNRRCCKNTVEDVKSLRPTVLGVEVYRGQSDLHKNRGFNESCEPPKLGTTKAR